MAFFVETLLEYKKELGIMSAERHSSDKHCAIEGIWQLCWIQRYLFLRRASSPTPHIPSFRLQYCWADCRVKWLYTQLKMLTTAEMSPIMTLCCVLYLTCHRDLSWPDMSRSFHRFFFYLHKNNNSTSALVISPDKRSGQCSFIEQMRTRAKQIFNRSLTAQELLLLFRTITAVWQRSLGGILFVGWNRALCKTIQSRFIV